jgi:hypothetical protein
VLGCVSPLFISVVGISQTASGLTQTPLPKGVEVRIEAQPKTGTVGDLIRIDLDVTLPADCLLEIPRLEGQIGDFAIIDFSPGSLVAEDRNSPGPAQTQNSDLRNHRARIIAAVYKTGTFEFPSIPLILKTSDGKEIAFSSPRVSIEIRSVLSDNNQKLKDLKQQAEIPEATRWILWFMLALAACILGASGIYLWRRRPRRAVSIPSVPRRDPLEIAEEELKALLARGHPDGNQVKKFYVILSEIAKRILESGYGIQTTEKTTSEIMLALGQNPVLEEESLAQIEFFLIHCDRVKFAKYLPSETEHDSAASNSLKILAEAKDVRRRTVVSDSMTVENPQAS